MQADRIPDATVTTKTGSPGEIGATTILVLTTKMELKMKMTLCCATCLVLSLQVLPGGLGVAQAASAEEDQVMVDGPYTIHQQAEWVGSGHMNEVKITVSQKVSFADLDLSRQADLNMLRNRVKAAARDNCLELERRFPSPTFSLDTSRNECIRNAARDGLTQAMTNLQMKAMAQRQATANARARLSVTR